MAKPRPLIEETAAPDLHFKLTLEQRVRGAGGPPAWSVRLRRIEDTRAALVTELVAALGEAEAQLPADPWAALDLAVAAVITPPRLGALNDLIARHNRWYPCEHDLPMDPRTGDYLDHGRPWTPMPVVTPEALVEEALRSRRRR